VSPTWRSAALVAAVGIAALALPWWLAGVALAAVAAATGADLVAVRRAVPVTRTLQPIIARGVPARLRLVTGPSSGRARVRQAATPALAVTDQEADGELTTTVVGRIRGRHVLPEPGLRIVGPLGLGALYRRAGGVADVLVYPDLPNARRLATSVRRGRFRFEGQVRGPLGLGTEFETVREYQPDDDIRHVNWRTTARLGRPMSNQYRIERDRDVICVVDCGRLMAAPVGDRTRLDAAVDASIAVAAVAEALSDRCGAIAFDRELRRFVAPRRAGANAVVQALFDVEPARTDSDYEAAFAAVAGAKRAWVLVLTDLLDENAASPLLEALPSLARRHAVAVATSTDEDIVGLLTTEPKNEASVYETAVAFEVDRSRASVVARVRRAGADIIDAPAPRLGASCVRSYLRAKSRALV
jgi:uncharacterized protein (DUF58 family)